MLLASEEWAKARGLPMLAYLTYGQVAANDFAHGEGLLMAPTIAVCEMLKRAEPDAAGLRPLRDPRGIRRAGAVHAQGLGRPRLLPRRLGRDAPLGSIDRSKLNPKGSSLAYGHPFAATGARILGLAAKQLATERKQRALISVCTAGGQGVTAIIERAA